MMTTKKPEHGFTLLELMIVLVIMSTLSVLSAQSIQSAIRNKIKLQRQIDEVSQVRDALKVIERDVNLAFHYTDMEMELREIIKKKRTAQSKPEPGATTTTTVPGTPQTVAYNPNDPNDPLNQKSENRIDPVTHFKGTDNQFFFATMNSSRLNEGLQQADFIKVGYLLQSCKRPGKDAGSGSCLIRKSSNLVEGDIDQQDDGIVLVTDVTEFKLRYFGKGKQDWVNDWDSKQGDGVAKGRYPDAVEISLTIERGENDKKKKVSMQIVAPIRFANNTVQDNANATAQAQQQGRPNTGGGNQ